MSIRKHNTRTHLRGGGGFLMAASGMFLFMICVAGAAGRLAIFVFKLKGKQ